MKDYILALGASNSKNSINKALAHWAVDQLGLESLKIDLNDYEMPIFSVDREWEMGIPDEAHLFKKQIWSSKGILISFAEHNGAYTTAFKNVYDWTSRIEKNMWENKPMFLLATSPGGRGASTVLDIAYTKFSRGHGAPIIKFSLPSFHANFSSEKGITSEAFLGEFEEKKQEFLKALSNPQVQ
jgi:chromate reductase